jgi:hypothetical protein
VPWIRASLVQRLNIFALSQFSRSNGSIHIGLQTAWLANCEAAIAGGWLAIQFAVRFTVFDTDVSRASMLR